MASPPSQSPVFPLEIFHLILKDLSYSEEPNDNTSLNIDDLRRCSLVCRAWVPIRQAHLFRSVAIDSALLSQFASSGGIIRAVATHPKIASYIQKIRYSITGENQAGHISDQKVSTLLTLLTQVTDLRSVYISTTIRAFSKNFHRCCAGDLVLSHFWDACISSTSLVDMSFRAIQDFPLPLLLLCPNLKSISLVHCDCSDWDLQLNSTTVTRTSKIDSLHLWGVKNISYAFLSFLLHFKKLIARDVSWHMPFNTRTQLILPFRGLEKLTFDYSAAQGARLWVLSPLSIAAEMGMKLFENLKDLTVEPESDEEVVEIYKTLQQAPRIQHLDVKFYDSSFIPFLNIHKFLPQDVGSLKSLHVRFDVGDAEEWQYRDTIDVLSESLSLVRSPASLTKLAMTATVDVTHLLTLFGMVQQLKTLDSALFISSSMFPLLRWITFHIRVYHMGSSQGLPTIDDNMKEGLYACVKSSFEGFKRRSGYRLDVELWLEHDEVDF